MPTRSFATTEIDAREFAGFFAPRLQFFLQQLHAHHHIEDDHYFPIFRRADERLVRGFEMLERDHDTLGAGIEASVTAANDFLRALERAAGRCKARGGRLHAERRSPACAG